MQSATFSVDRGSDRTKIFHPMILPVWQNPRIPEAGSSRLQSSLARKKFPHLWLISGQIKKLHGSPWISFVNPNVPTNLFVLKKRLRFDQ